MSIVSQFFGRFHPLIVHLPIGFLLLAFIFECVSFFPKYKKLKSAIQPSLLLGALSAVLACITGYLLKQEGGYDESLVDIHQVSGISTAILSFLLLYIRRAMKSKFPDPRKRKKFRIALFVPLILLLSVTGHLGGSLTHGEEYLSFTYSNGEEAADHSPVIKINTLPDSVILYSDIIQPLLEARCYSCHSSKKQKGQLRLDRPEFIERGGKHGNIFVAGLPDSSELYIRLMLPLEDEHHMPPNEKPQLSSTEIALLQAWIAEGAGFDIRVSQLKEPERMKRYLTMYQASAEHDPVLPEKEIEAGDQIAVEQLKNLGVIVLPVSENSNYLMVNFINARAVSEDMLTPLIKLKDQIVWLNLAYSSITDKQLSKLIQLSGLRFLYLNHTTVTDAGLKEIGSLKELRYLNLVGTPATDSTLTVLSNMKQLKNLYLFQTRMTEEGIHTFQQHSETVVTDTGNYRLEKLASDTIHYTRKL